VDDQRHAPAVLLRERDHPGQVWMGAEDLAPTGIRSPNRPARSESLYRLRYGSDKYVGKIDGFNCPSCHVNCSLHKQRDRRHETNVCSTNTAHIGRDRRPLGFVYLNAGLLAGSQYASRRYCDRPFRHRCCGKFQRIPKFRVALHTFYVAVCS